MRKKARQHLEDQLRRLEEQREETKRKLRVLAKQTQREQRYQYGVLVELAGLTTVDHGTLLGGLCDLAAMIADQDTASRWKTQGDAKIEEHRQRKAHRKRAATSMVDGSSPQIGSKADETRQVSQG
jgi:hypothetical protein